MKFILKKSFILAAILFGTASISNAQVKIGANPATMDTNNALEVEAANGNKTTVNKATGQVTITGQVAIKDGTQGADRILTSDANGSASWKSTSEANMPTLMVKAYNPNTLQPTGLNYSPPVPLVSGDATHYNPTNGSYTVPESGFYEHNISLEVQGIALDRVFTIMTPIGYSDGVLRGNNAYWNTRNVSGIKWFEAGEVITVGTNLGLPDTTNLSAYKFRRVSIIIFKR